MPRDIEGRSLACLCRFCVNLSVLVEIHWAWVLCSSSAGHHKGGTLRHIQSSLSLMTTGIAPSQGFSRQFRWLLGSA